MWTLDRYIVRQFLLNFAVLTVVLMTLFVVIDLIVDLDEFLQAGRVFADRWWGSPALATVAVIVDFYVPMVLLIYVFFSGLIVAGAMGFTVAHFQRQRELTAVMAGGVSLYRVAMPIAIAGVALSLLTLPIQEFALPEIATKLTRSKASLKNEGGNERPMNYLRDGGGNLWSAGRYDAQRKMIEDLRVVVRAAPPGHADAPPVLSALITADEAWWDQGRQAWKLVQGNAQRPGAVEPAPVEWVETDLSPSVLMVRRASFFPAVLSLSELESLRQNEAVDARQRAVITRTIWGRFSLLVVNVLLVVMALPFFLRRVPVAGVVPAVQAAGLCLGAWAIAVMLQQSSPEALPPVVSAWLPVALYLPLSAYLAGGIKT